jgi:hypothetical protein
MKVICPGCKQSVSLPDVEKASPVMGHCSKCKTLIHVSYEKIGGRKVWDMHFEKPPPPKKPKPKEFWFWVMVLIVLGILFRVFRQVYGAQ